jgi:hypothetical protein
MLAPLLKAFPAEEEAAAVSIANGGGGSLVDVPTFLSRWLPTVLQALNPTGPVTRAKVQAAQMDRSQAMALLPAGGAAGSRGAGSSGGQGSPSGAASRWAPPIYQPGSAYGSKSHALQHQQLHRWAPKSFSRLGRHAQQVK